MKCKVYHRDGDFYTPCSECLAKDRELLMMFVITHQIETSDILALITFPHMPTERRF
jgi:hypothetical protein